MDAFTQAVEDARRRLSRLEGRDVSIRDLALRAGVPVSTLHYILRERTAAAGRRRVRGEVVEKLAAVLKPVISRDDLVKAAQISAGYQVTEENGPEPDLGEMVVRYLQEPRSAAERLEVIARLNEILLGESRRIIEEQQDEDDDDK